jgi:hypothetical protein
MLSAPALMIEMNKVLGCGGLKTHRIGSATVLYPEA